MKYKKWNKIKLTEQLKHATKLFHENPTQELAITINTLQDLIDNKPNIFIPEERFTDQLELDKTMLQQNEQFIPYIQEFAKLGNSYSTKTLPFPANTKIPTRTLLSFVHDFYNSLDREIARYFNKIYKERHNNLRITTSNAEGFNRNYMTYINTFDYAYINITRTNTLDDFTNLVHEYAHAIADQMRFRPRYGNYPFIELLPQLMEEIAQDEILRCYEKMEYEVFKLNCYTTKTVLRFAEEIAIQQEYLTKENPSLERKQFISSMAQYTNNTKTKTERIINTTIQEKLAYIIPYMVMIELYDMYYNDPEKAMDSIKKIITMDECDDYIKYLESLDININEHSEEHIERQKKLLRVTTVE